jgi:flagellar biosynthetic protein FliQ
MFQAATQINEMTLTFIPKLMVVALALMVAGPWMLQLIMDFVIELFTSIPELIG